LAIAVGTTMADRPPRTGPDAQANLLRIRFFSDKAAKPIAVRTAN